MRSPYGVRFWQMVSIYFAVLQLGIQISNKEGNLYKLISKKYSKLLRWPNIGSYDFHVDRSATTGRVLIVYSCLIGDDFVAVQ